MQPHCIADELYGAAKDVWSCRNCCSLVYGGRRGFSLGGFFAPVGYDVSSNDASRRTVEDSKLQVKSICLVAQLNNVTLERGTMRSLARDPGDDIINLRSLLNKDNNMYKLLGNRLASIQIEKEAVAFERDARHVTDSPIQALLHGHRHACNHDAERFNDGEIRLKESRDDAANKAEDEVRSFSHRLVLTLKNCVGKHICHVRASVSDRS